MSRNIPAILEQRGRLARHDIVLLARGHTVARLPQQKQWTDEGGFMIPDDEGDVFCRLEYRCTRPCAVQ